MHSMYVGFQFIPTVKDGHIASYRNLSKYFPVTSGVQCYPCPDAHEARLEVNGTLGDVQVGCALHLWTQRPLQAQGPRADAGRGPSKGPQAAGGPHQSVYRTHMP